MDHKYLMRLNCAFTLMNRKVACFYSSNTKSRQLRFAVHSINGNCQQRNQMSNLAAIFAFLAHDRFVRTFERFLVFVLNRALHVPSDFRLENPIQTHFHSISLINLSFICGL